MSNNINFKNMFNKRSQTEKNTNYIILLLIQEQEKLIYGKRYQDNRD